jgi:parvulin-like peptidyl-prolyl isomerase
MTLEQFREQMRKNLMLREVMNREVQPRVELKEEDLRRYYQSHRDEFQEPERLSLREVIVLESSDADARRMGELASELREQLLSGKKLEEAVAEYAEQGLVTQPVDLGWVEIGDLDQDLEEAVWGLAVGEVSTPILARGGLHLIQLSERQEARLKPFPEVQQEIEHQERQRKYQEELRKYMDELEARSYIVANPPPDAAGFRRAPAARADAQAERGVSVSLPEEQGILATEPASDLAADQDDGPP